METFRKSADTIKDLIKGKKTSRFVFQSKQKLLEMITGANNTYFLFLDWPPQKEAKTVKVSLSNNFFLRFVELKPNFESP